MLLAFLAFFGRSHVTLFHLPSNTMVLVTLKVHVDEIVRCEDRVARPAQESLSWYEWICQFSVPYLLSASSHTSY